jgi:hypothetical protein
MTPDQIIAETAEKWGEYIQMADDKSAIMTRLLASLLIQERKKNEYYEKRIKSMERLHNVSF